MKIKISYAVFIITILGTIGMILFPPLQAFQYFPRGTYAAFQGYFWIFYVPHIYELTLKSLTFPYVLKVDLVRLILQIIAWWLMMLLLSVRRR